MATSREPVLEPTASLSEIAAFIGVATTGSFTRAADELGLTRPAISKSIGKLERELGVRLFHRTTRSVSLTEEGQRYFDHCAPCLDQLREAALELRDLREAPRGPLRVTAAVGFGRQCIGPLLGKFCERYPDVQLDFRLDDRPTDFVSDRVDVAIRNGRAAGQGIVMRPLAPMRMIVCASPGYLQQHRTPRSIEDLVAHRCIGFRFWNGRLYDWEFEIAGELRHLKLVPHLTFNDGSLALEAGLAGLGILQMPGYVVANAVRSRALIELLPGSSPRDRAHYVCYLDRRAVAPRIRAFIDFLFEHARQVEAQVVP
jgi:DNA-binding transcriptional LysR family regulator